MIMLLTEYVEIALGNGATRYYENLGYEIPRVQKERQRCGRKSTYLTRPAVPRGYKLKVKATDLPKNSGALLTVQCDDCGLIKNLKNQSYRHVIDKHNGKYYCKSCSYKYTHVGDKNANWNPNLTEEYRIKGRMTDSYLKFIRITLKRDNFTCQCCGKKDKDHTLEVHHLNGYDWYTKGRTDPANAITLCINCHFNYHSKYGWANSTKEQFEEWFGQALDNLKEYNGELPRCKEIYCFETDTIYESARHVKEALGLTGTSGVYACCLHQKRNRKYMGYHFLFKDEYIQMSDVELKGYIEYIPPKVEHKTTQRGKHPKAKKCICLNTKEIFECMQDAIDKYSTNGVRECCNNTRKTSGVHPQTGERLRWMFLEDYIKKFGEVV